MNPAYIWQHPQWPNFTWDEGIIGPLLSAVRYHQGQLAGMMQALGMEMQNASSLQVLTLNLVKSCEIEGVLLDSQRVRSSVARHLGIEIEGLPESDRYTDGLVEIILDATHNASHSLDAERLFAWHCALFPTGRSGMHRIAVGAWRYGQEPMQVVSGCIGREVVHYEAPPSSAVPGMMEQFFTWVEDDNGLDPILKAAIAHLWFVAIHPFDDGNGRIARTITDMLMCRADALPHRYYSISNTIYRHRKDYYTVLEKTTTGAPELTCWLQWFLEILSTAIKESIEATEQTLRKHRFWLHHRRIPMNERQVRMVNMLWEGFQGHLTNAKWAKITKTSSSTALRDIQELVAHGVLMQADGGGRSTHYLLADWEESPQ